MTKKPVFEYRAMAARHCKEIAKLTYEAFPFEREADLARLGPTGDLSEELKKSVGPWNGSVHLVAIEKQAKKEKVVGFVAARWLKAEAGRVSTGVITMPRLVVDEAYRGKGIGTELLKKILPFAANLKFGEIMASIPDSLASWYSKGGWIVSEPGEIYSLLEQPHMGDDLILPEPPPAALQGKFSVFHSQEPGPVEHGYTRVARCKTGASSTTFITSWTYSEADGNPMVGLLKALPHDPHLMSKIPLMNAVLLLREISEQPGANQNEVALYSTILQARLAKEITTIS